MSGRSPYQKIHLFDIKLEGQEAFRESDEFANGTLPAIIDVKGFKIGLSICDDVRFSELYHQYHRHQVDVITVPSAFLVTTGLAHWHTLLRGRAIEGQCYVVAPAQTGVHTSAHGKAGQRETFGHSLAVNPWGEILVEVNGAAGGAVEGAGRG